MRNAKFIMIILLCFFFCQESVYSQDWFGKIVPLQTTKEGVEKLISARPNKEYSSENTYTYFFRDWTITVDFSPGRCVSEKYGKWSVEKGIVVNVFYETRIPSYKDWVKLSYIEKNVETLKKQLGDNYVHYTNLEKGIDYATHSGRIYTITYFIPPQRQNSLKCTN